MAIPLYRDPSATIYGDVRFGDGSSFWPHSCARAEMRHITVGRFTNIQDFAMLHIGVEHPTLAGDYCSIAHHVTLHGCTIEDDCLIGINATIMDGCVVGRGSIVAGHTLLREGTIVPPGSIVMGAPGKVVRSHDATRVNLINALLYHRNAQAYAQGSHRAWENLDFTAIEAEADRIIRSRES